MNWEAITGTIAGYLWALPLIIVALTSGLIYSIRLKFPQVRRIKDMVKYLSWRESPAKKEFLHFKDLQ